MEVTPIIKGPGRVDLCFLIKTNFLCLNLKSKSLKSLTLTKKKLRTNRTKKMCFQCVQ